MLNVSGNVKVFASLIATDMRKSFSGLVGIVEKELGQRIETGNLFLFFNRKRDRLKVLWFSGDGLIILYKQLERGTFEMLRRPIAQDAAAPPYLTMQADELSLLLGGIELASVKRRKWWRARSANENLTNIA